MKNSFFIKSICILFFFVGFTSCRDSDEPSLPNILFCIADDASYPLLSAYGCHWIQTPAIDRIAEEGILFHNAYTPNAKCAPSRSCILTGLNSWQLKQAANHWPFFPSEFRSVVEILGEHGYHTGFTGKGWAPGIPGEINGKQRELIGKAYNHIETTPPTKYIAAIDYSENFRDFLKTNESDKPWFFWYGGKEPHRAYAYGSGVEFGNMSVDQIDKVPEFWPDNEVVRNDMLDYAFEVKYFDKELNEILNILDASGEMENTVIIVTADNGMPFPRIKGQEYEMSNHLPLAIMWKNGIIKPGREITDMISFIDFAPTFLELADIEVHEDDYQFLNGKSMMDIFTSGKSGKTSEHREYVLIGKERHDVGRPDDQGYPIRGIIKEEYLFLHNYEISRWPAGNPETGYLNCDGSPTKTEILNIYREDNTDWFWDMSFGKRPQKELYNIKEDPLCINNLIHDKSLRAVLSEMEQIMLQDLEEQGDPRISGKGEIFDAYTYADKKTVNFYNRYMSGEKVPVDWVVESDFEIVKKEMILNSP